MSAMDRHELPNRESRHGRVGGLRIKGAGIGRFANEGRKSVDFFMAARTCGGGVATILWIIAAVLVIVGILTLIRGGVLAGIGLIVVGLLIGPGGVSIFC
jgi:hypothetical protein